jgi:hypothetical protein
MKKIGLAVQYIIVYSLLFGLTTLYFFAIYTGYKKQNIDLTKLNKVTDLIENRGIGYHVGSKNKSEVFFIKLKSMTKKLGVYRMSKHYEYLISEINIGDTVTVFYYNNNDTTENINIDLVQLEKNEKLILLKDEYEEKESSLMYIGFFGILAHIYIGFRAYRKYKLLKEKKSIS